MGDFVLLGAIDALSLGKKLKAIYLKSNVNLFHFKIVLWVVYVACFKIVILVTFNLEECA